MQSFHRQARGFTLLEVMLVLLLMGLIVGTVSLTAFSSSQQDKLEEQARRFQVVFDMASDFAVLNQLELGLRIDENQYQFLVLDDEQKWQYFTADKIFTAHELPEDFSLELQLEDLPWQEEDSLFSDELFDEGLSVSEEGVEIGNEEDKPIPPPQVLVLSSGEFTPFQLWFKFEPRLGDEEPVFFRIDGEDMPPLALSEALDSQ
ncbi:type II secretion system minor pseudopilin GspH [Aliiglaciecola sp. CAU 1673]|uniref:type II secretion system minor pseudopilin GspH n=1 Tax=Aliiglaciecola sp. CAU 1673 TaxID=3032595 RepID=UPI0023DC8044|nr:type II secretion system minor pseudopilin GspH [Aliiglaciecola sp. CAU 1673]MDF2179218.1 type II secretion system minor pseudopilin GspH [Aliiglaciecola sp. CAU 1673]